MELYFEIGYSTFDILRFALQLLLKLSGWALKKTLCTGCSKMPGCKAPKILRSEAYMIVRRSDEG
jgi:hypothetical protein